MSNCQSIVSWHYASKPDVHFPLLGELYLPRGWIEDEARLSRAGVPEVRRVRQNARCKKVPALLGEAFFGFFLTMQ